MRKAVLAALLLLCVLPQAASAAAPHHYIFHQGTKASDQTAVAALGFDRLDYSSKAVMDATPPNTLGIFYVGNWDNATCAWATGATDSAVQTLVTSTAADPKFSGIYFIADEPHSYTCPGAPLALATRTANIKTWAAAAGNPNVKTFIDVAYSATDNEYAAYANSADYIGADPYPCGQTHGGPYMGYPGLEAPCNWTSFTSKISQAVNAVGTSKLVPVFQSTGEDPPAAGAPATVCSNVLTDPNPFYTLPEVDQEKTLQSYWDQYDPSYLRPWDATYEWLTGWNSCPELSQADSSVQSTLAGYKYPDLQSVFKSYFAAEVPAASTFSPTSDTYVDSFYPTTPLGDQAQAWTQDDTGATGQVNHALMKFTVSGVGTRHVTNATLNLKVYDGTSSTVHVYPASNTDSGGVNPWTEGAADWNNRPAETTSSPIATLPSLSGGWHTIDLTSYVTGDGTYSIAIDGTTNDALGVDTKEDGSSNQESLTVTAQQ